MSGYRRKVALCKHKRNTTKLRSAGLGFEKEGVDYGVDLVAGVVVILVSSRFVSVKHFRNREREVGVATVPYAPSLSAGTRGLEPAGTRLLSYSSNSMSIFFEKLCYRNHRVQIRA